MKYSVHIKSKDKKSALIEGAQQLGVASSEVFVSEESGDAFIISLINSPGEFEIEVMDDKMASILRVITPPSGTGTPVTAEDIENSITGMGVIFGIDQDTIHNTVKEVQETGKTNKNITIAKGCPPQKGEKAKIELKIGRDAANKDPRASGIVKPGQIIAVKTPATPGVPGKNIFGEDVPAIPGDDILFSAGENVVIKNNGTCFVSEVYGTARGTWQNISVTDYIKVSKDRMWVEMTLFPVISDNSKLSFDDIAESLKNKGIKYGINSLSIQTALEKGEPVENFRVAEAIPAIDGINAKIDFQFKINDQNPEEADKKRIDGTLDPVTVKRDIVFGGDILARKIPAVKQEDGKTVTGDVIKGVKPGDRKIKAGSNVISRDNGSVFVVSDNLAAGYPDYYKDTISVEDPLTISEDKLSATITLYPVSSEKQSLTIDLIKKIINNAGIKYGVSLGEVEKFLSSVEKKSSPLKKIIVAQGKAPVDGTDAIIDIKFEQEKRAGSVVKGTDRMDFREQAFIHNVKKGDILAEKIPLTTGNDGENIFAETIPASPGKDKKLIPGANAVLSDNGLRMTSDMDGMVIISDGNRIAVLKSHEVTGDIDMNTGNLSMDGSLVIKGWICTGFVVRASGEIHVGKGIEQATVDAGAGLYVHGGILGGDKADILSGAKLSAFFIENAKVHAKGDITIRDDIRNSSVSTGSSLDATAGKGRIIGGTVTAFREINANEIGTIAGVKTSIIVGVDPELSGRMDKIAKHLEEFKRQRAKIDMCLARFSNKELSGLPKSIRFRIDKLIIQRRKIAQMEAKLNKYKEKVLLKEKAREAHPHSITVNKTVYAGTRIKIDGSVLDVNEDISEKVTFCLDDNYQVICK